MTPEGEKQASALAKPRQSPLLLDAQALATLLGVHRVTVHRLNVSGKLPRPVRLGGRPRWRRAEIEAWVLAGCPARTRWRWPS
jgi:predicted DNA-binding transcriptional regulator AlpA